MTTVLDDLRRGALAGARTLTLRSGLTEFPREVFGLSDTLEVLDLSGNALTSLPEDFGRLRRLRVLFCSNNRFTRLPPPLGDCAALSQVGFRDAGLRELPAEALPPALRWLTLTGNRLERLPDALGRHPLLQKLMLSGNRLRHLPGTLADAANLELLRLSANRLDALPSWLAHLPRLAWLAWAGNPLDRHLGASAAAAIDWSCLKPGRLLGEGASGTVHQALWQPGTGAARAVAVKLFKHAMTSDGLPERELAASLAAGEHPNLTGALGRLTGHPDGLDGLVMTLLPDRWRPLAGPPSLESCSRDVYGPSLRISPDILRRIAAGTAAAAAHLHAHGLLHGDLYAHNVLWDGAAGDAVLSDFGAASFLPAGPDGVALRRLDVLAWGLLLGELLDRCAGAPSAWRLLQRQCVDPEPAARPSLAEALDLLGAAVQPSASGPEEAP